LATARKLAILAIFRVVFGTFFGPEARDQNHGHSHDYEDVGKVECRPMPGLPMKIEIVDHVASKHSIDDIPKCATQ